MGVRQDLGGVRQAAAEKKKEKRKKKKNNIVRVCVKASRAEGDAFTQTRLLPTFGVSAGLSVEHCRPKAAMFSRKAVQQKGRLRVQRWVFRV